MTTPTQAQDLAAAAAVAASASAWSTANDAAQLLFGVPIGVLLAAAAGAFFARTFLPPSSFWATMRAGIGWTLCGAYSLPLALYFMGWPSSIAASIAFCLSCLLQLLAPALVPVLIRNSPAWILAVLDRWSGRQHPEKNDNASP